MPAAATAMPAAALIARRAIKIAQQAVLATPARRRIFVHLARLVLGELSLALQALPVHPKLAQARAVEHLDPRVGALGAVARETAAKMPRLLKPLQDRRDAPLMHARRLPGAIQMVAN